MYTQQTTPIFTTAAPGQQPNPFHPNAASVQPNAMSLTPMQLSHAFNGAAMAAAMGTAPNGAQQQQQVIYVLTPIASSPIPFQFTPQQQQHPHQAHHGMIHPMGGSGINMASPAGTPSMTSVRIGLPATPHQPQQPQQPQQQHQRAGMTSPPGATHVSSPPQYQPTNSGRPSPNFRSGPTPINAPPKAAQLQQPIAPQAAAPLAQTTAAAVSNVALNDDDFEDTLNEMTIRSATAATITSIEDFLMGSPAFDDPAARRVIDDLRKEITDKVIRSKVMRLPRETCDSMVSVFEADQALMMVQCTRERGNIVAPLIEKLGPESTFHLIRFALENLVTLAHSQGGCIALPRILSFTKQSQTDVFFEQAIAVLPDLFCHQFGNFVVKHFLTSPAYCSEIIKQHLLRPGVFVAWATTRSGSHLIDEIFKMAEPAAIASLCRTVFTNPEDLRRLAFDQFGNYSVQSGFKALEARCNDAQLHAACAAVAGRAAKDSPYAQNIMKKVAQGYKAFKARQSTTAAPGAAVNPSTGDSPGPFQQRFSPPTTHQHRDPTARVTPSGASGMTSPHNSVAVSPPPA